MSLPSNNAGMDWAWIGVGVVYANSLSAAHNGSLKFNVSNDMYFCKKYPDLDVTREVLYTTHNSVKLSTSVQRYAFCFESLTFSLFQQ
jgi:hypothetical protein